MALPPEPGWSVRTLIAPILGVIVTAAVLGGSFYLARTRPPALSAGPTFTPPPVLVAATPNALAPVQIPHPPDKTGAGRYLSTDVPQPIPDNARKGAFSHILIPDHFVISSTRLINLQLTHPDTGELLVRLLAPDMTVVVLADHACAGASNWGGLTLDDGAAAPVAAACASNLTGDRRPTGALAALNGLDAQGDWVLNVVDSHAGNSGILAGWGLQFTSPAFGP